MMEINPKLYGVGGLRTTQRNIVPGSIKNTTLGNVAASNTVLAAATTSLSNGDQAVITITVESASQSDLLSAEPYISLYVGTVTSANQLPGGSGIDESQWQVIGPFYDWNSWSGSDYETKMLVYVRNISAGASQTVNIRTQTKYLSRIQDA